tara:strand:+ start:734 stop:904 length:171 start_codon:yes stop_codon:yes gene_type:complete
MKDKKWAWNEQEEESFDYGAGDAELDLEHEEAIDLMEEDDEIDARDAAFLKGYLGK